MYWNIFTTNTNKENINQTYISLLLLMNNNIVLEWLPSIADGLMSLVYLPYNNYHDEWGVSGIGKPTETMV
jgi:hypothetical protein